MELENFEIHSYSKSELALRYNPMQEINTATRTLRRWIQTCVPLHEALKNTGYSGAQKLLTPLQVQLIVKYLGEP